MPANTRNSSSDWPNPTTVGSSSEYFFIKVVGFAWNCPTHITPRYTVAEMEQAVAPLRERIARLKTVINKKK